MLRLVRSWAFQPFWCGTSCTISLGLEPWEDCQVKETLSAAIHVMNVRNERFTGIYGSVELEMGRRYNFYFKARSSNFTIHAATKCVGNIAVF